MVNVTLIDFVSFALIRQIFNQFWILSTFFGTKLEAIFGSLWEAKTAVSSAKVATVVCLIVGKSAVY
jgi:hypothetical protein